MINKDLELLKLITEFAKPYRKVLLLSLILLPLSSIAFSLQPYLMQRAIDGPLKAGNYAELQIYIIIFLGAILFNFCVHLMQIYVINSTAQKIITDIRLKLFDHLEKLPMTFFDKNPVGRSVTRLTSDVEQLSDSFAGGMISVIIDCLNIITIIVFMLVINWKLCLCVVSFLIPVIFLAKYFQDSFRKSNHLARQKLSVLNSFLQQNIVGISVVQMLNCADKNKRIFDASNQEYFKANDKSIWADANFSAGIELVSIFSLLALLFLSKEILLSQALTIGVLLSFLQYAQSLFEPVRNLSDRFTIIQSGFTAAERINELLKETGAIEDKEQSLKHSPAPCLVEGNDSRDLKSEYLIEFNDVWFRYSDLEDSPWILKGVSFSIKPYEFVAIVGATGSGKSSIIKLITRLYEPQQGKIKINGHDLKDIPSADLREFMGVIHQDSYIFAGDLRSNIELRRMDINLDRAKPFLDRLNMNLDTKLNERATNISSGEEQLINFARAVVSEPQLLILDEATAKIDLNTEAFIQEELEHFRKNRTLLVVAHRLETIKNADKVISIQAGVASLQVN
ncbi:MAG: ABC transporter ATP-binding protein/permease [Cyanobacteria bacterium REEB446]|nr:ABC transporter ATP-binding protein/permease [Cyanobacteria bacterium REEB446]